MTMPHLMNCPHSGEGWCLGCVAALNREREDAEEASGRAINEAERQHKAAASAWAECEARGKILDDIQREAGGAWWFHAVYELRRLRAAAKEAAAETSRYAAALENAKREIARLKGEVVEEPAPF